VEATVTDAELKEELMDINAELRIKLAQMERDMAALRAETQEERERAFCQAMVKLIDQMEGREQLAMSDFLINPPTHVEREQTFGEKAVGLTFNPSGDHAVHEIKEACARVIDILNELREATGSGERKRMYSVAITDIQAGQMWGVKAVTWRD